MESNSNCSVNVFYYVQRCSNLRFIGFEVLLAAIDAKRSLIVYWSVCANDSFVVSFCAPTSKKMDATEQLTFARRGRMTKSRRHECINSFRDISVADGVPAEPQTVEKAYLRRDKFPSFLLSVGHIGKAAVFVVVLL